MQEKKTLFVGQIVAQHTLIGHFDVVSTTSRLRALQNLPSAQPASYSSLRKGLWEGRKNQVHFELPLSKNSV